MTHFFSSRASVPVLAALSLLLVHCQLAAETRLKRSKHNDQTSSEEDEQNAEETNADGTNNPSSEDAPPVPRQDPVLMFTFDGRSLRARIRSSAANGASLVAGVFAAQNNQERAFDCASLKQVSLAGARATTTSTGEPAVLVDVPADASVLSRLDGNLRTAVHGCLMDAQGQVVSRYATSLMNAWDADDSTAKANPRIFHGVEAYANKCIDELGEIPMYEGGKPAFDCRDASMQVVPITATDSAGGAVSITKDTPWPLNAAQMQATQRCDRPAWLDYGNQASACAPYTRIGRYTNKKGSRFVIICRRYTAAPPQDPNFDIVGVIAHNPNSGKTCWFNGHMERALSNDSSQMPPPNTPTADRFWMNTDEIRGQGCPKCHDSDPFIHTPWMDQAVDAQGHFVVPRIGDDPAYTLATKYSTIGVESFGGSTAQDQAAWRQPQHLTNIGSCASCHRIGAGDTMRQWAGRSVGSDANFQSTWMTNAFRTFTKLHWMPTTPMTEQQWAASPDAQSMRLIAGCATNPSACGVQDVPH